MPSLTNTVNVLDYEQSLNNFCDAIYRSGSQSLDDPSILIYADNYLWRHVSALGNIYPTLQGRLGKATFEALAHVYVRCNPAQEWDINVYGQDLNIFIAEQIKSHSTKDFDWLLLAKVAEIEYAISTAYYSRDRYAGVSDTCWINLPSDINLNREIIRALQQNHPYIIIRKNIFPSQSIVIWRENLRVKISNSYSTVELKKLSGNKYPRCK